MKDMEKAKHLCTEIQLRLKLRRRAEYAGYLEQVIEQLVMGIDGGNMSQELLCEARGIVGGMK